MIKKIKKSKKMDPKLLSKQKHEVAYLAKKLGTTQKIIRDAHVVVGRSRNLVTAYVLGRKRIVK